MPDPARRRLLAGLTLATPATLLGACTGDVRVGPQAIAGKRPDGFVDMHMVQAAYIGSGNLGRGELRFHGRTHRFTVGGAGIGGIGASTVEAEGDVYELRSVERFPGAYAQARYGIAVGQASAGELWLQNEAGVIMRLKARRTGLMLSLGADAIVISMA